MAKVNLFEFGDILHHAVKLGYHWNQAHEFMVSDGIPPMYEINKVEYYLSDLDNNDYGWSDDTVKVLKSFFLSEGINRFTLVND